MASRPSKPMGPPRGGSQPGNRPRAQGGPSTSRPSGEHFRPAPPPPVPTAEGPGRKATGRSLKRPEQPSLPPPTDGLQPQALPDGASPFQQYVPNSQTMTASVKRGQADTTRILAIVGGLAFMIAAALAATVVILVVGWQVAGDRIMEGVAGVEPDKGHVKDTGIIAEIPDRPVRGPRVAPEPEPEPVGPQKGPATILIDSSVTFFHSIEVNCPENGIRARARFRGGKATVYGIPPGEDCMVTFQGSEPEKAYIRGHQTKRCTFNPTVCKLN